MAKPTSPTGPGAANVEAAKQLKDAMTAMAGVSAALERSFQNQAKAMQDMAKAVASLNSTGISGQMTQMSESIKQALDAINKLAGTSTAALTATGAAATGASAAVGKTAADIKAAGDAASRAADSTEDFGDILGDLTETTEDFGTKIQKIGKYLKKEFPIATGAVLGALSGLAQGFRNVMAVGKGVIGIFETVANTAFELATAILAIPFSIYNGLIDMAKKHAATMLEYAQAVEKVRENFGALSNSTPKAIFGTARALGTLKLSGVSSLQVFGTLAERIEKLNALFMAGGPAIRNLSKEFVDSGGALLGYQKGLGLSDEMMGSIAQQAQSMGKPMGKILNDMTKQALAMGKAFSLDSKIISREMGKAMMDMKHFGDMSVKQIGQAVVYAEKLGVSLEKITGVMDSFSTFDAAAENVSKLNEAFNTNINAMELLQAESPAEQLEILRKEMARAGVDGEKLDRHYRSLISQTTSLDDATIKAAFSSKNQGVSLKEIQKQSEKAEKKTMSQAEAMSKLSDSMERLVKAMDLGEGGFFAAFLKGITEGIMKSPQMVKILGNIASALSGVIQEGRALGTFLMKEFPGIKDFTDGLADLFNPARIRKLFADIRMAIQDFVSALSDPNKKFSFGDLMEKIKKAFFDFFNKEEPAGQKTIKGFNTMFMAISKILAEGIKWALMEMAGLIRSLIDFIKNPKKIPGVGSAGEAMTSFFDPIIAAIAEAGPILWSALVDLFELAFSMLFNWIKTSLWGVIEPYMPYIAGGLALIFFGPVFLQSMLGAFIGAMTSVFIKGVTVAATQAASSGMLGKAAQALATAAKSAPVSAPSVSGPTAAVGAAITGAPDPASTAKAQATGSVISGPMIIKLLLALAGIIAIGLIAFYAAAKMAESMSKETIVKALAIIGVMAINLFIVSGSLFLLGKMPPVKPTIIPALVAAGAVMLAIIGLGYLAVNALGGFTLSQAATAMMIVIGVAMALVPVSIAIALLAGAGALISGSGGAALAAMVIGLVAAGVVMYAIVEIGKNLVERAKAANITGESVLKATMLVIVAIEALGLILGGMATLTAIGVLAVVGNAILAVGAIVSEKILPFIIGLGQKLVDVSTNMSGEALKKATQLVLVSIEALGLIVGGMATLTAIGVLAVVGNTVLLLGGLVSGKILDHIMGLGKKIVEKAAELNEGDLTKASKLTLIAIQSLSLILTGVFALTSVASVGIIGTIGTLLGGSVIKKMLTNLVDVADVIIQKAALLPADIDKKVDTIIKAIDAVVGMISSIPALIQSSSKRSGSSGIAFSAESVEPQIAQLTEFVDKLFSKMITLVEKVIEAVKSIGASENTLKAAAALASIMAAIAEVLKGLAPPPGFSEALKAAASTWGGDEVGLMKQFSENAERLIAVIAPPDGGGLIGTVVGILTSDKIKNAGFTENSIKGIQAIGEFLKVVPELAKAVTPPDNVMDAAKEANKWFSGTSSKKVLEEFTTTAKEMGKIIGGEGGLLAAVTSSVTSIIEALTKNKVSEGQASVLQAVSPILKSMFEVVSSIVSTAPAAAKMKKEEMEAFKSVLTSMKDTIVEIFKGLEQSMPLLIEKIQKVIGALAGTDPKALQSGISILKDVFELIKTLITVFKNPFEGVGQWEGEKTPVGNILRSIQQVDVVLAWLVDTKGRTGDGTGTIYSLAKHLDIISGALSGIKTESIKKISEFFATISSLLDVFKDPFKGTVYWEGRNWADSILLTINAIDTVLKNMATTNSQSTTGGGTIASVVANLFTMQSFIPPDIKKRAESLNLLTETLKQVTSAMTSITANSTSASTATTVDFTPQVNFLEKVTDFFVRVTIATSLGQGLLTAANDTKKLLTNSIRPTLTTIDQIITETVKLQTQLERGMSLDIPTKLRVFAGKSMANLGANGKYRISTSPVVVNVNFAIAIDSKELEKTLVCRKGSIIRDRIHYLLGLTVGGESKSVYDMHQAGKDDPKMTTYMNEGKLGEKGQDEALRATQYDNPPK